MVNMQTADATENIAFSSSRTVALFEHKMLQNSEFSIQLHHYTLSKIKTQVFTLSDGLACLGTLRGSETTLNPGLFNKTY